MAIFKHLLAWLLGWAALCAGAATAWAQAPAKYSFHVVPQYNAAQLHQEWSPLLARISTETGIVLELKIAASIPKFETEFLTGRADFAYLNPYHALMAYQSHGYLPLVRDRKALTGVLVTRKAGSYQSIMQLANTAVAFPAPNAFGASLYMRALLAEELGVAIQPRYVKTHSNVLRMVARNEVAAGGSINAAVLDEAPELRDLLNVIYTTPPAASHPISVNPRVSPAVRQAFVKAFLGLSQDEAGRAMLREIRTPEPTLADFNRDYLPLKKLKLEKYLVSERD